MTCSLFLDDFEQIMKEAGEIMDKEGLLPHEVKAKYDIYKFTIYIHYIWTGCSLVFIAFRKTLLGRHCR